MEVTEKNSSAEFYRIARHWILLLISGYSIVRTLLKIRLEYLYFKSTCLPCVKIFDWILLYRWDEFCSLLQKTLLKYVNCWQNFSSVNAFHRVLYLYRDEGIYRSIKMRIEKYISVNFIRTNNTVDKNRIHYD